MKESVIAMLEELIKQMEDMKLRVMDERTLGCNIGIDTSIDVVKDKIAHIRAEITA